MEKEIYTFIINATDYKDDNLDVELKFIKKSESDWEILALDSEGIKYNHLSNYFNYSIETFEYFLNLAKTNQLQIVKYRALEDWELYLGKIGGSICSSRYFVLDQYD